MIDGTFSRRKNCSELSACTHHDRNKEKVMNNGIEKKVVTGRDFLPYSSTNLKRLVQIMKEREFCERDIVVSVIYCETEQLFGELADYIKDNNIYKYDDIFNWFVSIEKTKLRKNYEYFEKYSNVLSSINDITPEYFQKNTTRLIQILGKRGFEKGFIIMLDICEEEYFYGKLADYIEKNNIYDEDSLYDFTDIIIQFFRYIRQGNI